MYHMVSTANPPLQPTVLFESNLASRTYALNRPAKLNALDDHMLNLLRPKIEVYTISYLLTFLNHMFIQGMECFRPV